MYRQHRTLALVLLRQQVLFFSFIYSFLRGCFIDTACTRVYMVHVSDLFPLKFYADIIIFRIRIIFHCSVQIRLFGIVSAAVIFPVVQNIQPKIMYIGF